MKHHVGVWGLAVVWSLASACGDSDKATEADYDDVAQALGGTVAANNGGGDIGSLHDSVTIAIGTPSLDISIDAKGDFVGNRLGLDLDYSVDCKDASGGHLERCGLSSDAASVAIKWSGELASSNLNASVSREGNWELTKIQSGTVDVTGDGHFDVDVQLTALLRDVTRHYSLNYDADYSAVQVQLLPAAVVGGSIRYSIQAQRMASGPRHESEASFDMKAELTFGSNATAMLTLDGKYQYAVNTSSGLISKMGSLSVKARR